MANVQTCWKRNGHSKRQRKTCPLVLSGGQVLESAEDEGINILFVCGPFIVAAADGVPDCMHTPIELEEQQTDQLIVAGSYSVMHGIKIFFPVHGNKFADDGMDNAVIGKKVAKLRMLSNKYTERDTVRLAIAKQLGLHRVNICEYGFQHLIQDLGRVAIVLVKACAADICFLTKHGYSDLCEPESADHLKESFLYFLLCVHHLNYR